LSDNIKRLKAIRKALLKYYPATPTKRQNQRLTTLAALIAGIVASKSSHLPQIASKAPDRAKAESRVKRYTRLLQNENVTETAYFTPFARDVAQALAQRGTLCVVFDGSTVGRGCITLMASVLYKKRALPIAWIVRRGKKGHFPSELHLSLLQAVRRVLPDTAQVVFLGDGEFDAPDLQAALAQAGWSYVCRTAKSARLYLGQASDAEAFVFKEVGPGSGQRCLGLLGVYATAARYGPVQAVVWHEPRYREPLYLLTNLELAEEACHWYGKRAQIETFFSDQKSRGFQLHKSHLSDPERLSRLMMAAALGYLWMVYLGTLALQRDWHGVIHRQDRCDISLFQLGLRLMDHFLNERWRIRVAFGISFPNSKSVR
jgi:hypothetical protein